MNAPFYATMALSMQFVQRDDIDTMATDGKSIFFNPSFVESEDDETIRGVVAHEVAHVANLHHTRRGNRDPKQWNMACDYAIDPQLEKDGFKVAKFGFVGKGFDGMSAEDIYAKLQADGKDNGQGKGHPQGAPSQAPQGQQSGQPQSAPQGAPSGATGQGKPSRPGDVLDADAPHDTAALAAAELETMAKVQQAHNVAKASGKGSAMGALAAAELKKAAIDWRQVLRRFVDSTARVTQQWHRPNRRHVHSGTYLPGNVPDAMGALVAIFDVSGSTCNPATLAAFLSELQAAIDDVRPNEVQVILCDTKIVAQYTLEPGEPLNVKLKGGGGTNMQPALDAARDAQAVICFTDCDFPRDVKDTGVPTLWARYGKRGKFPKWGEAIQLP